MTIVIPTTLCTVDSNKSNVNFEIIREDDEIRFHLVTKRGHISGYYLFALSVYGAFRIDKSELIYLRMYPFSGNGGVKFIDFDDECSLKIIGIDEV
jgi:hypothetical protein